MLVLQVGEWMQIWRKVLPCAWWTAKQKVQKEWWQKCSGYVEKEWAVSKNRETCFGRLLIKYTTIGLRISGYGGAEVCIDFAEELTHTETNPMCSIDSLTPRYVMLTFETRIHRLEWFAQVILISVTLCSQIWGSVSGRDGMARTMCPWSTVEAGSKHPKIKGEKSSSILLTFGKVVPACIKS